MKKKLTVLLCIVIALAALCIWQRNNIKALYLFLSNDKEGAEAVIEKNRKDFEDKIKGYGENIPRNFTEEEESKIASGELSIEDATNMLLEEMETNAPTEDEPEVSVSDEPIKKEEPSKVENNVTKNEPDKKEPPKTEVKKPDKAKEGEIIKRYTAQFYSMKAYYIGQLGGIEAQAKKEYGSLTKEQKKSLSKAAFAGKYISYATTLQSECDSKVEEMLSSMKAELAAVGGDASIISVIRQAYNNEKAAKKAYYMNLIK